MPRLVPADELEAAIAMFGVGICAEQIADIQGISARTVLWRLARTGLRYRRRRLSAQQLAFEVRRGHVHLMRGRGLPLTLMGMELGLRPRSLRAWMTRNMPELYDQMKAEVHAAIVARSSDRHPEPPARPPHPDELVRPAPLSRAQRAVIPRHYLAGYSIRAIARHFRQHRATIWRLLRRSGVPMRPRASRSPMWLRYTRAAREQRRP